MSESSSCSSSSSSSSIVVVVVVVIAVIVVLLGLRTFLIWDAQISRYIEQSERGDPAVLKQKRTRSYY